MSVIYGDIDKIISDVELVLQYLKTIRGDQPPKQRKSKAVKPVTAKKKKEKGR